MTTAWLTMSDGDLLSVPMVDTTVQDARDGIAAAMKTGASINLNGPDEAVVVNTRHVLYAKVTP